jgi:hypothetical protein
MLKGLVSSMVFVACLTAPVVTQAHAHSPGHHHRYHPSHAGYQHYLSAHSYKKHWKKHDSCVRVKPGTHHYVHVC